MLLRIAVIKTGHFGSALICCALKLINAFILKKSALEKSVPHILQNFAVDEIDACLLLLINIAINYVICEEVFEFYVSFVLCLAECIRVPKLVQDRALLQNCALIHELIQEELV